jgi:hypothetical protein
MKSEGIVGVGEAEEEVVVLVVEVVDDDDDDDDDDEDEDDDEEELQLVLEDAGVAVDLDEVVLGATHALEDVEVADDPLP